MTIKPQQSAPAFDNRGDAIPALTFTGERYHPEVLGEIRQEHMHRYAWALDAVASLDVVDLASGEGFGSFMLSKHARTVVGLDVSGAAVEHAAARYRADNLRFVCADAANVPLPDNSADVVVSFETIEHVLDQEKVIAEIRRVLRPRGFLIMSSPNTEVYAEKQGHVNQFHTKELTGQEFEALLRSQFPALQLFGQRLSVTSSILSFDKNYEQMASVFRDDGVLEKSARAIPSTMYYVGVAAEREDCLPDISPSFLASASYDVYWQLREHISNLETERSHLTAENKRLDHEVGMRDARIGELSADAAAKDHEIGMRDTQIAEIAAEIAARDHEIGMRETQIAEIAAEIAARDHEIGMRDARITEIAAEIAARDHEIGMRDARITEIGTALAAAQAHQMMLEARLSSILSSLSWKLTRPLRSVKLAWLESDFRRSAVRGLGRRILARFRH